MRAPIGVVVFELGAPSRNEHPFHAALGVPAGEARSLRSIAARDGLRRARVNGGVRLQQRRPAADIGLHLRRQQPADLGGCIDARGPARAELRDGRRDPEPRRRESHGARIAAHRQIERSLGAEHPITRLIIGADVRAEDESAIVESSARAGSIGVRLKRGSNTAVVRLQIHVRRRVEGVAAGNAEVESGPGSRGNEQRRRRDFRGRQIGRASIDRGERRQRAKNDSKRETGDVGDGETPD